MGRAGCRPGDSGDVPRAPGGTGRGLPRPDRADRPARSELTRSGPQRLASTSTPRVSPRARAVQVAAPPPRGGAAVDTVAIGDQRNDIEMLHWAARGVAMDETPDEVKAIANEVTGHCRRRRSRADRRGRHRGRAHRGPLPRGRALGGDGAARALAGHAAHPDRGEGACRSSTSTASRCATRTRCWRGRPGSSARSPGRPSTSTCGSTSRPSSPTTPAGCRSCAPTGVTSEPDSLGVEGRSCRDPRTCVTTPPISSTMLPSASTTTRTPRPAGRDCVSAGCGACARRPRRSAGRSRTSSPSSWATS